ncbi:MAG TPA: phosphoribosyltransferase family protein [Verrucomicrobiae bacterium]|nr:phosphoribosyltransferase family protein [Verrucomicrobiae bacterium]
MGVVFESREDAGRRLAEFLKRQGARGELVLGLPRGGVVVAAEVAHTLALPLDVLVVRKIGHPLHREFAVGAMAEGGVVVLDEAVIGANPVARAELQDVIKEEQARLNEYQSRFHQGEPADLRGKAVLLVDDGLATGATTEAAVLSVRKRGASHVLVAAPVASTHAVARLRRVADDVLVMWADPDFDAVGRYYDRFLQTTDAEVLGLLKAA